MTAAHSRWLQPGDVALVPHGNGHRLQSEPGVPVPNILDLDLEHPSDRYEILRHDAGGAPTTLLCGAVRFDHPAARNLIELLPQILLIDASDAPRADRMQSVFRLMAAEAREFQPGGEAVITRLADILVIEALRAWIESAPAAQAGWLGALQDRQIGRALALMHRDPAMQYLTRWRMQVALSALEAEGATVAQLADRLGYRSEAAFARAFKRVIGFPPGAVKQQAAAA